MRNQIGIINVIGVLVYLPFAVGFGLPTGGHTRFMRSYRLFNIVSAVLALLQLLLLLLSTVRWTKWSPVLLKVPAMQRQCR